MLILAVSGIVYFLILFLMDTYKVRIYVAKLWSTFKAQFNIRKCGGNEGGKGGKI